MPILYKPSQEKFWEILGNFGNFSEILDLEGNFQGKFSERNFEFGGKFRHPNFKSHLTASLFGVLRRELTESNLLMILMAETSRFRTMEAYKIR